MVTRRTVSLSLGAALGALAARTGRAQPQPSVEEMVRMPVVYSVPGMADVRVREGLVYKTVQDSPLHFDWYAPAAASNATPAVILIHGGPGTLGIDASRLALWAFSGGGPLLAAPLRERPSWLKLVVAYYAVMEPFGGGQDESLSAIAALGRDASNAPPIVLARAGRDIVEINSSIDRFVAAANAAGATVDLLTHPTGRHGFDILDPGERSSRIIERTIATLRQTLGG